MNARSLHEALDHATPDTFSAFCAPPSVPIAPAWRRVDLDRSELWLFGADERRCYGSVGQVAGRPSGSLRGDDCPIDARLERETEKRGLGFYRPTGRLIAIYDNEHGERVKIPIDRHPVEVEADGDSEADVKRKEARYRERCRKFTLARLVEAYQRWRALAPERLEALRAYEKQIADDARESHARQALIDAAPALLAAIEPLVDWCEAFKSSPNRPPLVYVEAARAAITKAKG